MARIRTIKPDFFTSGQVVECSTNARLLFLGLLCFSDDRGVHPASHKRLKMEVFPGDLIDDSTIKSLVNELRKNKLVTEFRSTVDDETYWHITSFAKHQRVDKPTYKYPLPPPDSTSIPIPLAEHSTNGSRPLDHVMEGNGMEGNGRDMEGSVGVAARPKKPRPEPFKPPTVEEVAAYCRERSNHIDAEKFVAHYASKGWVVGKSPMKNWKMAVITWEKSWIDAPALSRVATAEDLANWSPQGGE